MLCHEEYLTVSLWIITQIEGKPILIISFFPISSLFTINLCVWASSPGWSQPLVPPAASPGVRCRLLWVRTFWKWLSSLSVPLRLGHRSSCCLAPQLSMSRGKNWMSVLFRWLAIWENSRLTPPKATLPPLSPTGCFIESKTRAAGHWSSSLSLWSDGCRTAGLCDMSPWSPPSGYLTVLTVWLPQTPPGLKG